jgi:hypothetical protein
MRFAVANTRGPSLWYEALRRNFGIIVGEKPRTLVHEFRVEVASEPSTRSNKVHHFYLFARNAGVFPLVVKFVNYRFSRAAFGFASSELDRGTRDGADPLIELNTDYVNGPNRCWGFARSARLRWMANATRSARGGERRRHPDRGSRREVRMNGRNNLSALSNDPLWYKDAIF